MSSMTRSIQKGLNKEKDLMRRLKNIKRKEVLKRSKGVR